MIKFIVPNARGYVVEIEGPANYLAVHSSIFVPDEDGMIPLDQEAEIGVQLPVTDARADFTWRVCLWMCCQTEPVGDMDIERRDM